MGFFGVLHLHSDEVDIGNGYRAVSEIAASGSTFASPRKDGTLFIIDTFGDGTGHPAFTNRPVDNGTICFVVASLNPLVPSSAEWLVMGLAVVHLLLWLAVLLWLLRQRHLDSGQRLLGLVLATALPVIGPLLVWWAARRPRRPVKSVDDESRS